MEMIGALTERRKDPRRRKDLIPSAIKWARKQFGGFVKDVNAIIILQKELADDFSLDFIPPTGEIDSLRSPFLRCSTL
jgi:hypothetical protein